MEGNLIIQLALVLILGVSAQLIAWALRLPSILLLLAFGFIVGPVAGVLHPDALFGDGLFPFISLAVAVILFEGGLSLRFSQLKGVGTVVRNLISVGLVVSWLLTSFGAYLILGLDPKLAALFGAIFTVSGPTVIIPLLRHVRPTPKVGSILRWEGILVDSVGAVLAILVFEFLVRATSANVMGALFAMLKTAAAGTFIGLAAAALLVQALKRYWLPDYLHNAVALMAVIVAYVASNAAQHEAGLFAVTAMGVALINQKSVSVKHIVEFKETLRTLLIASLFIVLSARMSLSDLRYVNAQSLAFLAFLLVIVRPASVFVSARGAALSVKEKAFLSAVYPRGIVAAAVSAIFALRLHEIGYPGIESFAPYAFITIVGTVAVYGLSALPIARLLGLAKPAPQGTLIIGANEASRAIGKALRDEGFPVLLISSDWPAVSAARMEALPVSYVRSTHDFLSDEIELGDLGRLFAITSNDELNSMVTLHYLDVFGRRESYQIAVPTGDGTDRPTAPHLGGRTLFGKSVTYDGLIDRLASGDVVKVTKLTAEFDFDAFMGMNPDALPLLTIDETGKISVFSADGSPKPQSGQKLVSLVSPSIGGVDVVAATA